MIGGRVPTHGWRSVYMSFSSVLHVVPVNDLIDHDVNTRGECVCVPNVEIVMHANGKEVSMYTHSSLDGRELKEPHDQPE